ncbi:hypothetical protein GYMLUDRAFT_154023, partial [Collybiopsis luxurians FD-317 M1]
APGPHQKLARYRQLSPRSSIHVSPLCLGGMSIGDQWANGFGSMEKESSFKLLDAYYDAGGNHIDTANRAQEGSSEEFIGEWMELRGIRNQMIVATKYTNIPSRTPGIPLAKQKVNWVGNNLKSMKVNLEISLKRLRTDYIDIYYVHAWDLHTSVEEIMDGLHNLVIAGKILYLGISNAPAWLVVKANDYARAHGKTPFVVYQAPFSILKRDIEREILPMCQHEDLAGIALTLYFVLAAGHIRTTAEEEQRRASGEQGRQGSFFGSWERTQEEVKVCDALEKLAAEIGVKSITSIAIAYVLHKAPYMFPIIGGRKVEHLLSNIEALDISLSKEQMEYLDNLQPFDRGYPLNVLGDPSGYPRPVKSIATIDTIPMPSAITPRHDRIAK